jgi:hypothetical protein
LLVQQNSIPSKSYLVIYRARLFVLLARDLIEFPYIIEMGLTSFALDGLHGVV